MFEKIKARFRQMDADYVVALLTVTGGVAIGYYCSSIVFKGKLELIEYALENKVTIPMNLIEQMEKSGKEVYVQMNKGPDIIMKLAPKS